VIIKTLLSIQPKLAHIYHACFPDDHYGNGSYELLGFDIILVQKKGKIKPCLLEVHPYITHGTNMM
jgi:hypothetical protein